MSAEVHLTRQWHDAGADAWCARALSLVEIHQDNAATDDPCEATCRDCLEDARAYGERARQRADRLRRGIAR